MVSYEFYFDPTKKYKLINFKFKYYNSLKQKSTNSHKILFFI